METTASLLVCRGCCCGTADPAAAADRLGALQAAVVSLPGGRVTATNCLGPCSYADVVAVRHRDVERTGRRYPTTWLRQVDDAAAGELADWVRGGAQLPVPDELAAYVFDPAVEGAPPVTADHDITPSDRVALPQPSSWTAHPVPAELEVDLLHALLADPGVGWTIGVDGAVADVLLPGGRRSCTSAGARMQVTGPTGSMKLDLRPEHRTWVVEDADGRAAVVLGTSAAPPGSRPVAEPVPGTFDLGVTGTYFAVEVDDLMLATRLRAHVGRSWPAVLTEVGTHLLAVSPPRVVATPVARAVVTAPIPPAGGASPGGSHTHLLPDRIASRQPLPQQHALPAGWWVGAVAFIDEASAGTRHKLIGVLAGPA
jgi:hypothetical protein